MKIDDLKLRTKPLMSLTMMALTVLAMVASGSGDGEGWSEF